MRNAVKSCSPNIGYGMTEAVQGITSKTPAQLSLVKVRRFREDEAQWSQWMVDAQQGNQEHYQALLIALGKAIEHYIRAHFGNIDFLEDCVQECLLAVHQGRHTYNPQRPFRPWLFAVVRNKAVDLLRKRRPDQGYCEDSSELKHYVSEGQAESLVQREDLFKHLAEPYREALILTKVIGLTAKEAAKKIGVSLPAMKVRVYRGLTVLRKQLDEDLIS